jgi:hypothetical protein
MGSDEAGWHPATQSAATKTNASFAAMSGEERDDASPPQTSLEGHYEGWMLTERSDRCWSSAKVVSSVPGASRAKTIPVDSPQFLIIGDEPNLHAQPSCVATQLPLIFPAHL